MQIWIILIKTAAFKQQDKFFLIAKKASPFEEDAFKLIKQMTLLYD